MSGYLIRTPTCRRDVERPLWDALRMARSPASVADLHVATSAHPNSIQLRLKRWERAGLVQVTSSQPRRFIMIDKSPTPPKVSNAGKVARTTTMRQRLWIAMRVLKRFDLPTIMMTAGASRRSAEDYINVLCRAGYVHRTYRGNAMTGEWSVYLLVKRSGPRAPAVSHRKGDGGELIRELVDHNDGSRHDVSPGSINLHQPGQKAGPDECVG